MNIELIAAMVNATGEERLAAREIEYFAKTARIVCSSRETFEQVRHPGTWRSLLNRVTHEDARKVLNLIGFEVEGGEEVDGKRVQFVVRIKGRRA